MDTDIRDELDRSFGDGPPIDDLDLVLGRGRAAVRRRRLAGAASMALAAGVVVGIALVSTGGSTTSTPPGPATGPSARVTTSSPPVVPDAIEPDVVTIIDENPTFGAPAVWFDVNGFLHAKPGVQIVESIPHPHGLSSAAVVYVTSSGRFWFVGRVEPHETVSWRKAPAADDMTFREWVAADETARWHYPVIEGSAP